MGSGRRTYKKPHGPSEPILCRWHNGLVPGNKYTFIALRGFDLVAAVSGDIRDPRRTIPRAMSLSLGAALPGIFFASLSLQVSQNPVAQITSRPPNPGSHSPSPSARKDARKVESESDRISTRQRAQNHPQYIVIGGTRRSVLMSAGRGRIRNPMLYPLSYRRQVA
jgi:hypothetical protein